MTCPFALSIISDQIHNNRKRTSLFRRSLTAQVQISFTQKPKKSTSACHARDKCPKTTGPESPDSRYAAQDFNHPFFPYSQYSQFMFSSEYFVQLNQHSSTSGQASSTRRPAPHRRHPGALQYNSAPYRGVLELCFVQDRFEIAFHTAVVDCFAFVGGGDAGKVVWREVWRCLSSRRMGGVVGAVMGFACYWVLKSIVRLTCRGASIAVVDGALKRYTARYPPEFQRLARHPCRSVLLM